MGTKIQINSLDALERLIGGDSEFEIEIRNSVVQEFAKKHLKSVAQSFIYKVDEDLRQSIRNEILKTLGVTDQVYGWNRQIVIPQKIVDQINYEIERQLEEKISSSTQKTVKEFKVEEIVKKQIETRLTESIQKEVNYQVEKRLKEIKDLLK